MNNSYTGQIAVIDLSSRKVEIEPTQKYAEKFLGGKGVNQSILLDRIPPGTKPYDADNLVVIGTGPLSATLAPSSGRVTFGCMNAFNNGVSESNAGGHFGPELKFSGFDHVIVKGASEHPCFITIFNGKVEIRDASDIWGKTTWEADDWIKNNFNSRQIHTALIGPAGENRVRGTGVIIDRGRAAARGGIGGVMGSKNLKGFAASGDGEIHVAKPERFFEAVQKAWQKLRISPKTKIMHEGGTHLDGTLGANEAGMITVRNGQDAYWALDRISKVDYPIFKERYEKRRLGCFACPTYCSHVYQMESERYGKVIEEGFEANTVWGFGGRLDITDPEALIAIHALNSQYGLDQDYVAVAISWAMELFELGLITKKDLGGLDLTWGNAEAAIQMIHRIAHREGFGDVLANGIARSAKEIGRETEKLAVCVKGQENMDECRAAIAWGFGVVVSLKGGGHVEGSCNTENDGTSLEYAKKKFGVSTLDPHSYQDKEKLVFWFERYKQMLDSIGLCYFTGPIIETEGRVGLPEIAEMLSAALGRDFTNDELLEYGQRAQNVQKVFNTIHAGFTRKDDLPPERFLNEEIKTGPHAGVKLDLSEWNQLLDRYYRLNGWDIQTSWPKRETLERLGLGYAADKLEEVGRIGGE